MYVRTGGFGMVYLAKYHRHDVAVKLIDCSALSDADVRAKAQELRFVLYTY